MEQNQNQNFYLHIFKEIFLLTWLSSVFQVIFWNWKHLINCKMQGKKIFWYTILHSSLCNILCKLFLKIESKYFSETYSEIESTWSIAKCRERKFFDTQYYIVLCATFCVSFSSKLKANIFLKHILKLKACDQSKQTRRKLFVTWK